MVGRYHHFLHPEWRICDGCRGLIYSLSLELKKSTFYFSYYKHIFILALHIVSKLVFIIEQCDLCYYKQ